MIPKENLWLMEEFFIGQFGNRKSAGQRSKGKVKSYQREGENNPKAGFSARKPRT